MTTSTEIKSWRMRALTLARKFNSPVMSFKDCQHLVDAEISDLRAENERLRAALAAAEAKLADSGRNAALKIATEALEEIRNWLFSWDGDCSVSRRAENVLLDIDAAMAAQQGENIQQAMDTIDANRLRRMEAEKKD